MGGSLVIDVLHGVVISAVLLTDGVVALVWLAMLVCQLVWIGLLLLMHEILVHRAMRWSISLLSEEAMVLAFESHDFAWVFLL